MPFVPNDTFACQICEKIYETGNHAFTLSCAEEGCRGHMCWECIQKAVFSNMHDQKCPHCRRSVTSYTYALFSNCKLIASLEEKLSSAQADLGALKRNIVFANGERDMLMDRINQWRDWSLASKAILLNMPPSAQPARSVRLDRSRSPPATRAPLGEYNG